MAPQKACEAGQGQVTQGLVTRVWSLGLILKALGCQGKAIYQRVDGIQFTF